ncbi:MAG: hypothetical protein J5501_10130 [Ruminococcus sp.]|nr:hypothetical protein [Ruminococcus sp.]
MIKEALDMIAQSLRERGEKNVYTSFDALPAERKGKLFTVIGIGGMNISRPVYSLGNIYIPFTAEAEIKLTSPESAGSGELLEHFSLCTEPALEGMSGLSCRLTKLTLKHDTTLGRLVLCAGFTVTGISIHERSGV